MSSDAIVLLKEEHKDLLRLFRAYRAAGESDLAARGELADQIVHALTVHSYIEDEVLYPRLRDLLPALDHEILQAYQEHHVVDLLCEEIAALTPDAEEFDAKVGVLIDVSSRHIVEEEQNWFPRVRAAVGRRELQEIGTRLLAVRETAPRRRTRPVSDAAPGAPG